MITWYKVAWIDPFFTALDIIAPGRDHATDGTIGDLTHATGVSGHNPDDTPGVRAERQDADTKPEVRALDADADLRQPGLSMQAVVDAILRTPRDRDRLIYLIYNRRIWRASNGWREEVYTGSDPHTTHLHASGHPNADDDGAPWQSILNLGQENGGTAVASREEANSDQYWYEYARGQDPIKGIIGGNGQEIVPGVPNVPVQLLRQLVDGQAALGAGLKELATAVAELRELIAAGPVAPTPDEEVELAALLRRVRVTGSLDLAPPA